MSFTGFSQEGLAFLNDLGANNNKPWFEAHRSDYQNQLLEPAKAFVSALGEQLALLVPGIRYDTSTSGRGTLMRIYRDTRFSKDKTPYKTELSGLFWEGEGKKTECPAFGFRLTASGMDLMAGMFGFPKPVMQAYRDAVIDDDLGSQLASIVNELQSDGRYQVVGEHYKRVPRGYDADHPRSDLLRYNGLYVHPTAGLSAHAVTSPALVDACMAHFQKMAPVQQWLADVMQRSGGQE